MKLVAESWIRMIAEARERFYQYLVAKHGAPLEETKRFEARVCMAIDPSGEEIYLDGKLVGKCGMRTDELSIHFVCEEML